MATRMTHLGPGFFWQQFKAGPKSRVLTLLFFGVLFILAGPLVSPWTAAVSTFITVPVFFYALFPEPGALQALGMNRARASQLLAYALVPAVLIPAVACLAYNPNWIGAAGAGIAIAVGLLLFFVCLPNDSTRPQSPAAIVGEESGRAPLRDTPFTLFWRRNLVWALVAGALTGLLMPLSVFIDTSFLRALLSTVPALVLWARVSGGSEMRAQTWQALGLPRKQWLTTSVSVVLAASALFAISGSTVAAIISRFVEVPASPVQAICFAALMGIVASLLALAGTASWDWLVPVALLSFWIPLRYPMDPREPFALGEYAILGGIQGGIALLIAVVLLWRYVSGRGNLRRGESALGL